MLFVLGFAVGVVAGAVVTLIVSEVTLATLMVQEWFRTRLHRSP